MRIIQMNYKISLHRVSQVYFRVACQLLKAALTVLRCFCYTAWPSNESYRVLLFRRSTLYKLAVQSKPLSGFVRRMFLKQLKLAVYISKLTWKIAVLWEVCVFFFFCKWDRCMEKKRRGLYVSRHHNSPGSSRSLPHIDGGSLTPTN